MRALSARLVVLAAGWVVGCAEPPVVAPPSVQLTVGVHDVAVRVPEGWLHLDHGLEHRFQHGLAQISLADAGPATPGAVVREIRHARELFRRRQYEDARAHLDMLGLWDKFDGDLHREELSGPWRVVRDLELPRELGPADGEVAYTQILAWVERLPNLKLAALVERALPGLDHGAQRAVAERHPLTIDGRAGVRLETWDRLSHDHRKSYLFVLNEGNLLVARMELGRFDQMRSAFDSLVESLRIDPQPAGS